MKRNKEVIFKTSEPLKSPFKLNVEEFHKVAFDYHIKQQ